MKSCEGGTAEIVGVEKTAQRQRMWKMAKELNRINRRIKYRAEREVNKERKLKSHII